MHELKAPSLMALAGESLTPFELTRLVAASPSLARQTRGRGEPVLVLPGLGASNSSTALLRNYLTWLGYNVQGWTLGRNRGNVAEMLPWVVDQLRVLHARTGSKVHAIGWSLGGILAREAAREYPETVTLGSPVVGGPKYTSMGALYTRNGGNLDDIEAAIAARESTPISVPVTSIYSKRDGIVGWQASIDRHSSDIEHIEVRATHLGLGISPEVFKILARKLANA